MFLHEKAWAFIIIFKRRPITALNLDLTNDNRSRYRFILAIRTQFHNILIMHHLYAQTYAIHLMRNGVDLRRLQQLLGHSNIQTTTVYLQFRDQDLREVYNKVEF
jgi:site-specific recombinase XerD